MSGFFYFITNRHIRLPAFYLIILFNIKAKYNDSIINIRIKANEQGGDEKNQIFYKKYDLFAAATCD
jgi:hypothetical protein